MLWGFKGKWGPQKGCWKGVLRRGHPEGTLKAETRGFVENIPALPGRSFVVHGLIEADYN